MRGFFARLRGRTALLRVELLRLHGAQEHFVEAHLRCDLRTAAQRARKRPVRLWIAPTRLRTPRRGARRFALRHHALFLEAINDALQNWIAPF